MIRLAILALLLNVATLFSADLTGTWRSDAAPPLVVTLRLQQNGNTLSGEEEIRGNVFSLANGRLDGDRIAFTISIPAGGRLRQTSLSGTFANGEIHLGIGSAKFILKRVDSGPEELRIERLASLIRLWGTIRFFHPYIASRAIDWDAAFTAAVPSVEHATSKEEFARAVSGMLAALDDAETHAIADNAPDPDSIPCRCRQIVRSGFFDSAPSASGGYYVDWENVPMRAPFIVTLWHGVRVAIRTAETVSPNTAINTADDPYSGDLPSREYRLLALARYWNAIHYFFGYPDSLDAWDSALAEFIPQFEAAKTGRDYRLVIGRLASRTRDGHSFVGAGTGALAELGSQPDIALRNIGGKIVVTASAEPRIGRGDVVEVVDGTPATDREKALVSLFPWSTRSYAALLADRFLLAGPQPQANVTVRKMNGAEEQIDLARDRLMTTVRPAPVMPAAFGRLPSGLGYIDLTRLPEASVDAAFDAVMQAPGIVFDLRGSVVSGAFLRVAGRLTDKIVPATRLRHRIWHGPDPAASTNDDSAQYAFPSGKLAYRGPIAVLIDSGAFSQSEHMALFLEATAAQVIFVGTPTSGTDGEVTSITLPGGIQAHFAALSIRHADGRPLERIGVLPDIWVAPTLAGIQQGRDEALERAISALQPAVP